MYVLTIEYLSGKVVDGEKQYRLTTVKTDREDYIQFLDDQFQDYFILDVEKIND